MPVILEVRHEDGFLTYQPLNFADYAAALTGRGMTPPPVPFRVRFVESASLTGDLQTHEQDVARFFGLGDVSGISYRLDRR